MLVMKAGLQAEIRTRNFLRSRIATHSTMMLDVMS